MRRVARQRILVERLDDLGGDAGLAEDLLEEFEVTLAEHQRHLAEILAQKG